MGWQDDAVTLGEGRLQEHCGLESMESYPPLRIDVPASINATGYLLSPSGLGWTIMSDRESILATGYTE